MALQLRLLGRIQVAHEGVDLTPRLRPRAQRLLAYLLLHRSRLHPRLRIASALSPDQPEKNALGVLRRALSDLRAALPVFEQHEWFLADRAEVQWNPDSAYWLDVEAFEQQAAEGSPAALKEAIALYTGDLLRDWYDEWVLAERERLIRLLASALEGLIPHLEAANDFPAAIQAALRLLSVDPLNEEAYRQLMQLYARVGDRTGALRTYQTCVAVLNHELKAQVSAGTRQVFEQVMRVDAPPARPRTNNLPIPLTTFVGRERESREVLQLLHETRLLTLTGPGGSGKTRLARHVAGELAGVLKDGVWLVELAALSDPALILQAVASGVGVREQPGHTLLDSLTESLRSKKLLILLDNAEHLLAACAQLAEALLRDCAGVRLLVTSRERLKVPGETVWPVPALSLPAAHPSASVDELHQSEALRLFVDRATLVLPAFDLNQHNIAAAVQICRRLDGLPLAIELAAARVRSLTVPEIAARLDDAFRLLSEASPVAPPRHHTLRATMDWSHALLSEREQNLFRRLAVFAGGWTLPAAEAICGEGPNGARLQPAEVLDVLSQLVDKSMVMADVEEGTARYGLLETIRQYARDRLLASGESEAGQARHYQYYLAFAESAAPKLVGPEQISWLARLDSERDNLRAALRWALGQAEAGWGLRLAVALSPFWRLRAYVTEGRASVEQVLARYEDDAPRELRARAQSALIEFERALGDYAAAQDLARTSLALFRELGDRRGIAETLRALGSMAWHQSDYAGADSFLAQSLALYREVSDTRGIADVRHLLGHVSLDQGHYARAHQLFQESLDLFRYVGDTSEVATLVGDLGLVAYLQEDYAGARAHADEMLAIHQALDLRNGVAEALNRLGDLARIEGDDDRAEALYAEGLGYFREIGLKAFAAGTLHNLGYIAAHRGDHAQAADRFRDSLAMLTEIGDRKGVAECLMGFAGLACAQGRPRQAARLFGAAEALREGLGSALWPANRKEYERSLAALRAQLDEDTLALAWAEGRALAMPQAIAEAIGQSDS